jgi:hypothetical protein
MHHIPVLTLRQGEILPVVRGGIPTIFERGFDSIWADTPCVPSPRGSTPHGMGEP